VKRGGGKGDEREEIRGHDQKDLNHLLLIESGHRRGKRVTAKKNQVREVGEKGLRT